jgi:hypothetical protein
MSVPLATLRRDGRLAWLHDPLDVPLPFALDRAPGMWNAAQGLDVRRGVRLDFADAAAASNWLRPWAGDVGATMALRAALQRAEPAAPLFDCSDEDIFQRVAERLARGALVAIESARPPVRMVMPAAPAPAAVAEPPAVPITELLAPPPTPAPLLPALEEVQIEGAEVLPEIEQSLEQVDITIGEIKLAPVSLEPTPSKVPAIQDALTQATTAVTGTLDGL